MLCAVQENKTFTAIPAHTCQDVEGDERSSQRKLQPASSQNGHVQAANVCGVEIDLGLQSRLSGFAKVALEVTPPTWALTSAKSVPGKSHLHASLQMVPH